MSDSNKTKTARKLEVGARLALMGVLINLVLAAVKISAGVFGHTYALIADGIESLLDIGSSLVLFWGLKFAAQPPDETHPYGHGKAEPIATMVVALGVLIAALGLAVESVREILTPHHSPAPFTLIILIVVVAIKETLFRKVLHAGEQAGSSAVQADAWHHRSDALTSIAAFIGISIAVIGGENWVTADDWAALAACALISYNGIRLFRPALDELMDTAPSGELQNEVRGVAAKVAGVLDIEKCRIRKMGLEFYVDIHIGVKETITVREGHEIAHAVKDAIREENEKIADVLVHIEPVTEV
ncbi:MAG: cation diffusion facilitator family transporter [Chthoniobacteraceae bacterium]